MESGSLLKPSPGIVCGPRAILVLVSPELSLLQREISFTRQARLFLAKVFYDEKGAIVGPALGAPQVGMLLENLAQAGVRELLLLGWVGAWEEGWSLGEVFLPRKALSAEGTSRWYFPRRKVFSPEKGLWRRLREGLKTLGIPWREGAVVSTDAPYREDRWFLQKYRFRAQAVDMETSAALAVGESLGMAVAACHLISDLLRPEGREVWPVKRLLEVRLKLLPLLQAFLEGRSL